MAYYLAEKLNSLRLEGKRWKNQKTLDFDNKVYRMQNPSSSLLPSGSASDFSKMSFIENRAYWHKCMIDNPTFFL